ncbi:exonuclease SbcCD subunit D [Lapidilactobacillus mulanensis]|uniref:Nuclease SbcCD subunit D n=1 Tax=Lapidilactobacillus mulanensis TaxID=2485999 RepID=A0ABW4DPH8_9LACO|nr:exonuclease SbcCD subunit D [Lapidilactobacillus mulanensis]
MRFLHTADWHLGRRLFGYDLYDEQDYAIKQLIQIAKDEAVDAIVVAGDLYDRQNPAEPAVAQLAAIIQKINLELKLPLLMINGNHDSAVRLGVGNQWYQQTNFYLHTQLAQAFEPVEMADVQFFLLPYFELYEARQFFEDDQIKTLEQAMTRIVQQMVTQFKPGKKPVLVAHFFAAGSQHSDSETTVSVGGLDAVPLDLLSPFDYVALGHVHNKEALQQPLIRYSGSLLKFSLSEALQTKGVLIVDTDPEIRVQFKPIKQLHEVQNVQGKFAELTDDAYLTAHHIDRSAYTGIILEDTNVISNASNFLHEKFPRFLTMSRAHGLATFTDQEITAKEIQSPLELLADFYHDATQTDLSKNQKKLAEQALQEADQCDH